MMYKQKIGYSKPKLNSPRHRMISIIVAQLWRNRVLINTIINYNIYMIVGLPHLHNEYVNLPSQ
jgi:hypothetical protein